MSEHNVVKCDGEGCDRMTMSTGRYSVRERGWLCVEHFALDAFCDRKVAHFCGPVCERDYEAKRLGLEVPAKAKQGGD